MGIFGKYSESNSKGVVYESVNVLTLSPESLRCLIITIKSMSQITVYI